MSTRLWSLPTQRSAVSFKKGFGYHPLGVWCENTQESLALMLRPGNAGSNTPGWQHNHIAGLTAAIDQVPAAHRKKLLIRADGAGASHGLLDWLTGLDAKRVRTVEYSVGYAVTDKVIARGPQNAWQPAITAQGEPREHGDMQVAVEITGMLKLKKWRPGCGS